MHDTTRFTFPHERLDAYHVALEMAELACRMASRIPRGHRKLADQLQRSGTAPVCLIAEGANRWLRGEKRQRFNEAAGEAGEAAGVGQLVAQLGLYPGVEQDYRQLRERAARVSAMTSRLVQRFS